jgi:transposase
MEGGPDGAGEIHCRACETITQPPAPFYPISRGRAGPHLLAMILDAKFANHLPLDRQSEAYAREGIGLTSPPWRIGSAHAQPRWRRCSL